MPRARIPDVLPPESTLVAFDKPDAWLRGFNRSQVAHLEVFGGDEDEEDDLLQQWGRDISLWDEEGWSNSGEVATPAATTHRYQNLSVAILAEEARRLSPIPPLPLGHPNW